MPYTAQAKRVFPATPISHMESVAAAAVAAVVLVGDSQR